MEHVSDTIVGMLGMVGSVLATENPPKPTASPDERRRALDAVKKLTGENDVRLEFRSRDQEPLGEDEPLILDTYVDGKDNEYWIEPHGGSIVQMGPESGRYSPPHTARPEDDRTVADLRTAAIDIVRRQINGFDSMISSLHPLEANDRRAIYFFRWEDLSEPLSESELPPFVQVGLYADGKLASFADTLSSHQNELPPVSDHITDLPESWTKCRRDESG